MSNRSKASSISKPEIYSPVKKSGPKSFVKKVNEEVSRVREQAKHKGYKYCCACFVCCKLASRDLLTYNVFYNLFCVTSALTSRVSRLTLLFLAILLEFSFNAFFYDLDEEVSTYEAPTDFSLTTLAENFWVALYSVLISMIPLLFISFYFKVSDK